MTDQEILNALATQVEVRILAGCDRCGRRLVHDGCIRDGSLVDMGDFDAPLCGRCLEARCEGV